MFTFQILRNTTPVHGRYGSHILKLSPIQFTRNGILSLCQQFGEIFPNENERDWAMG